MIMRRKIFFSLFLVMALIITPQNAAVNTVEAAGEIAQDISGVTAEVNIVKNGDLKVINALTSTSYEIDGVTYNNYSKYDGLSAFASTEKEKASNAIDGNTGSRWETVHGEDPQYITVDFGNVYTLKDIAIFWEGASAKEYTVDVSQDGLSFETVTTVTSNEGKRTDDIKLSEEIGVRAVRIFCNSRVTQYGDSIFEIGFYGTSPQGEVVPVLSNLQVKDYSKYTGKYLIYFNEPPVSEGYNVYIDNKTAPVKKIKSSGRYITAEELSGYDIGVHTLYVTNIGMDGKESAAVSKSFTITGENGNNSDVPQVYIYTDKNISSEYHKNADVAVSIVDKMEEHIKIYVIQHQISRY